MNEKLYNINVLIRKANSDYVAAASLIGDDSELHSDIIAFHCQQCIEKYLKAFLIYHDVDYPKTHNLELLLYLCLRADKDFEDFDLEDFSAFGVAVRYDDITAGIDITQRAFEMAKTVMEYIKDRINLE